MNSGQIFVLTSIGYDLSNGPISCTNFSSSPISRYIPFGETWSTATSLWQDSNGTIKALSGFYSDGALWRFWDSITESFTSQNSC